MSAAAPELYDLVADPAKRRDLAGDAGHAAVLAEMEARLRAMWDPEAVDDAAKLAQARIMA